MSTPYEFDVFLSHSSKDKHLVRPIAERLRADGLKVWFDEFILEPGDSIPSKINHGLENSRTLALFMSANAFGSDWAELEGGTYLFRDPLNKERRLIPVRLDDAEIKGALKQFLYIDRRKITSASDAEDECYIKLREACGSEATISTLNQPAPLLQQATVRGIPSLHNCNVISLGHVGLVLGTVISPDGKYAFTGCSDQTVRKWDLNAGRCVQVFEAHTRPVLALAISHDGTHLISCSEDRSLRQWHIPSGLCLKEVQLTSPALTVAFAPDGTQALTGNFDSSISLWDLKSGECLIVLRGHTAAVWSVVFSQNGKQALSGSADDTLRHWSLDSGECLDTFNGHTAVVRSVAFSPDGHFALSGSDDGTVCLWDLDTGECLPEMNDHAGAILSISLSANGHRLLSASADGTVRLWSLLSAKCVRVFEGHNNTVRSTSFLPDGKKFVSTSDDGTLKIWSLDTGSQNSFSVSGSGSYRGMSVSTDFRLLLSGSDDGTAQLYSLDTGERLQLLVGHKNSVYDVALSRRGHEAVTASEDGTLRIWDLDFGQCLHTFEGHAGPVRCVTLSSDGTMMLSASDDKSVRLWSLKSSQCLKVLEGHREAVWSVAFSPNGKRAVAASIDHSLYYWDLSSGSRIKELEGHTSHVFAVAFDPKGQQCLSGSSDGSVRLWDLNSGRCLRVFEGHADSVWSVAFSQFHRHALSGAANGTIHLWDLDSGSCLGTLVGHSNLVANLSFGYQDGRYVAISGANNGIVRIWPLEDFLTKPEGLPPSQCTSLYTNAKVLLVGDSGSGKTALSRQLANLNKDWEATDSTVGAWATQWKIPVDADTDVQREIWLWDFGGQADQRLIHQLYMDETALAVLVFDGQKEDLFESLGQWDRDLARASRKEFRKLLVAGRVDAGGLRHSRAKIETFQKERGYRCLLETSAKTGLNCEGLKQAILSGIDWDAIPWRSSPVLFQRLKEAIIKLKDEGRVLMRLNELRDALRLLLIGESVAFNDAELKAVIRLLAGPGVVWELDFGSWVLLQPEQINAYAQAVIQTMREDAHERGCLPEERVLNADLTFHRPEARLPIDDERIVLLAMHQILVGKGLCLREKTGDGPILTFPSYYRRERPELVDAPAALMTYKFSGFLDDIYATLVVKLHHTKPFEQKSLWRYAADFETMGHKQLGVKVERRSEGAAELVVYADPAIPITEKLLFVRYVHEHLSEKAPNAERLRHYCCPQCQTPVGNREVAMERLGAWITEQRLTDKLSQNTTHFLKPKPPTIICVKCEKRVNLWDDIEQYFMGDEIRKLVHELQTEVRVELNNESRERALVGEIISTVANAGQISREFSISDHGIAMEIEFITDPLSADEQGEPTGKKIFLYLSLDPLLEEFDYINIDPYHVTYWKKQARPVMLVARNSQDMVHWGDMRKTIEVGSAKHGNQNIVTYLFREREPFNVMSVRRWREKLLKK